MSKLLLIGAGCSRNYLKTNSAFPNIDCPLDRDFFLIAKKVILQGLIDQNLLQMIDGIINDLCKLYGYEPVDVYSIEINSPDATKILEVLDDKRLSLEKVMTELSLEMGLFLQQPPFYGFRFNEKGDYLDLLSPLIELIAVTISKALEGPPCSNHKKLAESLGNGDSVISFNYDILMDNALRNSHKLTDYGYLVPFQKSLEDPQWTRPEDTPSEVELLKLHGSMNWLHCSYCGSYFLTRSEKMGSWYVSLPKNCPKCRNSSDYLERVIIPPLLAKDYSAQPINYLWREAARRLSRTREVIVIGYSFPPTDFAVEALLRSGLPWNCQKETHFTIVDPDKNVFERFSQRFNMAKVDWKGSLAEYLDNL